MTGGPTTDAGRRQLKRRWAYEGGGPNLISQGAPTTLTHSLLDPAFLVILAVGIAIRFIALGQQSFWYDEIHSVELASGAPSGDLLIPISSIHGPLYLILLRGWMALVGTGEGTVRVLSAILGSVGLVVFYRVALRLAGRGVAIVALALLALSPFHLWYSQEARNYALLFDLGLLAVAAIVTEIERRTKGSFVLSVMALCATCFCNLSGFFLLPFYGLYALLVRRRTRYPLWRMIALGLVVIAVLSPWLIRGAQSTGQLSLGRPTGEEGRLAVKGESPPGLLSVPFTLYNFSLGMTVGPSVEEMKIERIRSVAPHLWWLLPAAGLFALLALRGMIKAPRSIRGLVILWAAVPILLMAIISVLNLKAPNSRYAILGFAPYLMVLSIGILSVQSRIAKAALFAAIMLLMAYSDFQYFTEERYWRPDTKSAAALIRREAQDGDIIVVYALAYPVNYYLSNGYDIVRPTGKAFADEGSMMSWLKDNVADRKRMWIVQCNGWWMDRQDRFVKLCRNVMSQTGEWQFTKVPVYLFENPQDWEGSSSSGGQSVP